MVAQMIRLAGGAGEVLDSSSLRGATDPAELGERDYAHEWAPRWANRLDGGYCFLGAGS
jgi:hypothetical protein